MPERVYHSVRNTFAVLCGAKAGTKGGEKKREQSEIAIELKYN